MRKKATIGLPIYKRLEHIPAILQIVASQDYPNLELIVSDNGMNGDVVENMVKAHYPHPFRFRQNRETATICKHFNQIIHEATGDYFVMLMDDDEISSNYVSELVAQIEAHPEASVAIARQETIDAHGNTLRKSREDLPSIMSGPDFILAMWGRYEFGFDIVDSYLAKTEELKACGGYPDFPRGNQSENALLIKLALNNNIVLSSKCVFRWRSVDSSYAWSQTIEELATGTKQFLHFLDHDQSTRKFAAAHPEEWEKVRACLVAMAWGTYLWRWRDLYDNKLSRFKWIKAAFALPLIPAYYRQVAAVFRNSVRTGLKEMLGLRKANA